MRKVKFTQDSFDEKLGSILSEFPVLDVGTRFGPIAFTNSCVGRPPLSFLAYECTL